MRIGVHEFCKGDWAVCFDGFAAEPQSYPTREVALAAFNEWTKLVDRGFNELRALEAMSE